jgi:hypothetical protein
MEQSDSSQRTLLDPPADTASGQEAAWDRSERAAHDTGQPGLWGRLRSTANHPNGLTLIRIAIIPLIIILFSFPMSPFMTFLAAVVFSVAAFTDYLDGFLARRQKVTLHGQGHGSGG